MQNIPSGSTHAKPIKQCFKPPKGWLFLGADFSSLEDRINALLTKDRNKLKVYTDGYDGHSLRAHSYWGHLMPRIQQATEDEQCFKVGDVSFKATDTVTHKGINYTGLEFFNKFGDG